MSAIGLSVENLTFSYDPKVALFNNLNFQVMPGEKIGIVGPSGCGKSTLLKLILGTLTQNSGSVEWSAVPAGRLGVVFQEATLLPWQNVLQNVSLPLKLLGKEFSQKSIGDIIENVGLKGWENAYPSQLSGGMKMRAALARALVTRPGVLFMDEPFSSLDEILRERLDLELSQLLQKEKITFFLVTHNVSEAVFLCDRIWVLGNPGQGLRLDYRVSLPSKKRDSDFFVDHEVIDQIKKLRSYLKQDMDVWGGAPTREA